MKSNAKKTTISPQAAERIARAIEAWRVATASSRTDLELIGKVSQTQISRILAGKFSEIGTAIRLLCTAADIDWEKELSNDADQIMRHRLHTELDRCWDGSNEHAESLTDLLRIAARLSGRE